MDNKTFFEKLKNHGSDIVSGIKADEEKNQKAEQKQNQKKQINKIIIWAIIIAIVVLFCVRGFDSGSDAEKDSEMNSKQIMDELLIEKEYVEKMEADLKAILERISGAGDVSVRIYIESTSEKILAEDSKKQSDLVEGNDSKKQSSSSETSPVISSGGSFSGSASPYVVKERLPYPIGVIVVADGARDDIVKNEIYEAVKALYGLSANRIKITY